MNLFSGYIYYKGYHYLILDVLRPNLGVRTHGPLIFDLHIYLARLQNAIAICEYVNSSASFNNTYIFINYMSKWKI